MKLKRVTIGMLTIGVAFALNGCGNNDDKRFLDALRRDSTKRADAGEQKNGLAREFGISRETLYQYLRADS